MASSESIPSNDAFIGTPITGSVVIDAITPGKCAAIPAAAIITFIPRVWALLANCSTASGVRCADSAFISNGTSISSKNRAAFSITGKSDVLPIIILITGLI
ncbi:hypothetical protein SDC9_187404 [bioreactor metagenome]|uniref:Uncharacterized protein n=1 Tax=bioreactor metagenome TaxID=1076179 RepID=A0A645HM43_9ZZZZ